MAIVSFFEFHLLNFDFTLKKKKKIPYETRFFFDPGEIVKSFFIPSLNFVPYKSICTWLYNNYIVQQNCLEINV